MASSWQLMTREETTVLQSHAPSMFTAIKSFSAGRLKRKAVVPKRVLIVDDEELVRRFVDRILTDAGYQTTVACDGPDALRAAAQPGTFDLVVTDLMMPHMNGDELARRLRQSDPGLKILYLTGFSDHLFKEKVMLWEDEAFLDKPCSLDGLRQAVALMLTGTLEQAGTAAS